MIVTQVLLGDAPFLCRACAAARCVALLDDLLLATVPPRRAKSENWQSEHFFHSRYCDLTKSRKDLRKPTLKEAVMCYTCAVSSGSL